MQYCTSLVLFTRHFFWRKICGVPILGLATVQKNGQTSKTKSSSYCNMKLKFIVAGPKGSGKTLISNVIAGQSEKLTTDTYNPTAGVRILEHEMRLGGINEEINIEIWDASGDQKYEAGWRAVMAYTDGVILVYDPDAAGQDQQLTLWYDFFVKRNGLRDEQCLIFAHRGNSNEKFKPPPLFSRVSAALTGPNSAPDIKSMFENFIREIHTIQQRK